MLALIGREDTKGAPTQTHRLFEHCVEDRRQVPGRAVDDLQHLGGRGLLLQSLARLGDEARILHRDDRLRRETLQQRYLFLGERTHLGTVDSQGAKKSIVLAQRHPNRRTCASLFDETYPSGFTRPVRVVAGNVRDMYERFTEDEAVERHSRIWPAVTRQRQILLRHAMRRQQRETLSIEARESPKRRIANAQRFLQDGIEDRGEIAGRGVDDPEHLGGRGLLFQSLASLGNQPRVLHRDDGLHREVLQQRKLLLCEGADIAAIDRDSAEQLIVLAKGNANTASRTQAGQYRRATGPLQHV